MVSCSANLAYGTYSNIGRFEFWCNLYKNKEKKKNFSVLPVLIIYSEEQNKPTICPFLKQAEVILRVQNIPLKCCQPLEVLIGLDLYIQVIWGL